LQNGHISITNREGQSVLRGTLLIHIHDTGLLHAIVLLA